jgi:sarcosine oxidase subunit alpha
MSELTGQEIETTGTTTFRPPFVPVSIGAMGAGGSGKRFAPTRLTTSHHFNEENNAPSVEAGLWYRPNWFPKKGETSWRQSCDREVEMVRSKVGVCDVSTLGKIDVQGPDSAALLDFVYTNKISSLKLGKIRYGLMLREDGLVMDDGTCARLGSNHFIITTTTAAAGQVMRHLEFVLQVLRPDIDAQVISVTEQWAQFSIAGPRSRDLLNETCNEEISVETISFMSTLSVSIGDISARLFRISFSGEHAYEIAVPASYGDAMIRLLVSKAKKFGGGPYGMEALNVLRIEKGFITHAEIDGRVAAKDIGMLNMISPDKTCIGKAMANRPGLISDQREQLVGIKPLNEDEVLLAGAHIYCLDEAPKRVNNQGHVTSVCYSPSLKSSIGLALVKNGQKRIGEKFKMVDHLRNSEIIVNVTSPVFFDKTGSRVRG